MAKQPLLDWDKVLPKAPTSSTYDPAKQLQGYQRRITASGRDAEAAADTRNMLEKALNLKPNQNTFWDIIEIINRPQQALFSAIDAQQKGLDVGEAAWRGISGQTQITGKDLLMGTPMSTFKDNKNQLDFVDVAGFALDVFADPIDLPLIPITGAASLSINILQKADELAKVPDIVKATTEAFNILKVNKKGLKLKFDTVEQFADVLAATKMSPAEYLKQVGSSIRKFQTPLEGAITGIGKGVDKAATGFDNMLTKAFEAYDEALLVDPKYSEMAKEVFDATQSFKGKYKNFKEGMARFVEKLSPFSKKFDYKTKLAKGQATLAEMELMYAYNEYFGKDLPDMVRKAIDDPNSIYFKMDYDDALKKVNEDLLNFGEIKGRFKPEITLDEYIKAGRSKWDDVIDTKAADYFEGTMRYILGNKYDDDFYRTLFKRQRLPNGEIGVTINADLMEEVGKEIKKVVTSLPSELNVQKNLTKKWYREQARIEKQQQLLKVRELKNADLERVKPIKAEFIRKEKIRRQIIKEANMTPDEVARAIRRENKQRKQIINVLTPDEVSKIVKQDEVADLTEELTRLSNQINEIEGNLKVLKSQERKYTAELLQNLHLESPGGFAVDLSDAQRALEAGDLKLTGNPASMEDFLAKVDKKDIKQIADATKEAVIKEVNTVGGVTVVDGKIIDATSGYQVGIDKITEQSFETIDDLMEAVTEAGYINYGVWQSPKTKRWVLDPSSRYVNSLEDALNIGGQARQITVWDWAKKQEWSVETRKPIKLPKVETPKTPTGGSSAAPASTPPTTPAAPATPAATPAASAMPTVPKPTLENLPTATPTAPVDAPVAETTKATTRTPGTVTKANSGTFKAADEYLVKARTDIRDTIENTNFKELPETPKEDSMVYQRYEELRDKFEEVFGNDEELNDLAEMFEGYLPEKKHYQLMDMLEQYESGWDEFVENRNQMEELIDKLSDPSLDDAAREALTDELDELTDTLQTNLNDLGFDGDLPALDDYDIDENFKLPTPEEREVLKAQTFDVFDSAGNKKSYKNIDEVFEELTKLNTPNLKFDWVPGDNTLMLPSGKEVKLSFIPKYKNRFTVEVNGQTLFARMEKGSVQPETVFSDTQVKRKLKEMFKADLDTLDGKPIDNKIFLTKQEFINNYSKYYDEFSEAKKVAKQTPELPKKAAPTLEGIPTKTQPEVVKTAAPAYNKVEGVEPMARKLDEIPGANLSTVTDNKTKRTANLIYKNNQQMENILNMSFEDLEKSGILKNEELITEVTTTSKKALMNSAGYDSNQLLQFLKDNNLDSQDLIIKQEVISAKINAAKRLPNVADVKPDAAKAALRDIDGYIDTLKSRKTKFNQVGVTKYDTLLDAEINKMEEFVKDLRTKVSADDAKEAQRVLEAATKAAEDAKIKAEKVALEGEDLPEEILKANPKMANIKDKAVKEKIVSDFNLRNNLINYQEKGFNFWNDFVKKWEGSKKTPTQFRELTDRVTFFNTMKEDYSKNFPNLPKEQIDDISFLFSDLRRTPGAKTLDSNKLHTRYNMVETLQRELGNSARTGKPYYQEEYLDYLYKELKDDTSMSPVYNLRRMKQPNEIKSMLSDNDPYAVFRNKKEVTEKAILLKEEVLKRMKKHTGDRSYLYTEIKQSNLDYPRIYQEVEQINNLYKFYEDAVDYAKKTLPKGAVTDNLTITGKLATEYANLPEQAKAVAGKYYEEYKYAKRIYDIKADSVLESDNFYGDFDYINRISDNDLLQKYSVSEPIGGFIRSVKEQAMRENPAIYEMAALKQNVFNFYKKNKLFTDAPAGRIKEITSNNYLKNLSEDLDRTIINEIKDLDIQSVTNKTTRFPEQLKYLNKADSEKYTKIWELADEIYPGDAASSEVVKAFEDFRKILSNNKLTYGTEYVDLYAMKRLFYKLEQRKFVEDVKKSKTLERIIKGGD